MLCISILAPRMWGDDTVDNRVTDIWHFNPRPTYVRRLKADYIQADYIIISILAPRMWGDASSMKSDIKKGWFQSSPHVCEATSSDEVRCPQCGNFNPRPTYVRRPPELKHLSRARKISILAPRMWGDIMFSYNMSTAASISILAPRMWGDCFYRLWYIEVE